MDLIRRAMGFWRPRQRPRHALALSGGGVIGGMYEVGALAALAERLNGSGAPFDVYIGCSSGSVVASLLANGIRATELYRILDQDLPDPLNFTRSAVYASDAFRRACGQFGRLVWAVGKNAVIGLRGCIPDMLARAERDMPAGFFSLVALERYLRDAFAARGLGNSFTALDRTLLIPAVDLDRAERVVFGRDELRDVPISEAIAASCAIPGFFEPFRVGARDYVDGGVGFCGHADLGAAAGADVVVVVNPLVPTLVGDDVGSMRSRGLYSIMEQASRISSENLLRLGLATLRVTHARTRFFLLEPPRTGTPLFGPSMGFEASRAALRFGYESTGTWLEGPGRSLVAGLLDGVDGAPAVAMPVTLATVPVAKVPPAAATG